MNVPELNYLTPEARKDWEKRTKEKMSREWTKSQHVRDLFEKLDEIFGVKGKPYSEGKISEYDFYGYDENQVGYLNPHASKSAQPNGYKVMTNTHNVRSWDVRFGALGKNVVPFDKNNFKDEAGWNYYSYRNLEDAPACFTDYGNMIFIIDKPQFLDILIKTGEFKMPKCAKNEVFIAMTPQFVEEHEEELHDVLEAARADRELFDIRKWYENGIIEKLDDKEPRWARYAWHGKVPMELTEGKLAERISDVVTHGRQCVISGYHEDKWGQVKDINSCLNLANAFMMDKDFITLPTIAKGKKIAAKNKWVKWADENHVTFDGDMDDEAKTIESKIDEIEDVIEFWNQAHKDYRVAILLDENEFANVDFVFDKMCAVGKLLGVDDYIDTYNAGVPAEDILA